MGLETLLEAAKYLEYKAEVEARGEKGFPDLPNSSSSSVILPAPSQNGFVNHHHHGIVPNGIHFVSPTHFTNNHPPSTSTILPRVPESVNGFKTSDHSYRRINHLSQSPTFDLNGGTNRVTKNSSNNSNSSNSSNNSSSSLSNRNSGTREVHNKLEKNRRAHLKECFELLKSQLPAFEDRKISNLAILRSSLRHIQTLKRKEREYEHEMERLAREKISLQQRLSTLKKDMLSKWDHLDWQAMVPEELDVDVAEGGSSGVNGRGDSGSVDILVSNNNNNNNNNTNNNHHHHLHHHHRSSDSSDSRSPISDLHKSSKSDIELEDSGDSQHPVSLTVNNCHIGKKLTVNKIFGQINGVNGLSTAAAGPISLVTTTKLSSSPLAAITVEKTANSPIGGASYVNMVNNSGKSFSLLNSTTLVGSNSKLEMGQYYDEDKMCK